MRKTCLYRIYEFSSAHRLNSKDLNDVENKSIYDKCNNFNGHGHDYVLEVGISGKIDNETGMIINLTTMDGRVSNILDRLDYAHLDNEIPYFQKTISTGENIIEYLWVELDSILPSGLLYHLKLWETNNNYFELKRN